MQKKKKSSARLLPLLLCMVLGGLLGFFAGKYATAGAGESAAPFPLSLALELLLLALAVYLQFIVHEGGHLICGLLTGYSFQSFRVGSLMLLRTEAGFVRKRMSLAGTGGQCLMNLPAGADAEPPFRLYLLGGSLCNAAAGILGLALAFLCKGFRLRTFLLFFGISGLFLALINGLPLGGEALPNDGCNVKMLRKDPAARAAFVRQLKVSEAQSQGVRLKDMPEEWFALPADADLRNPLISSVAVFRENRHMDRQDFAAVRTDIAALTAESCRLVNIYRSLLMLDRVFLELLEQGEAADISALSEKEHRAVLNAMKDYPSVLRTRYAAALLKEQDKAAAEKILKRFEKIARRYPYAADIASERELIELARRRETPAV